MTANSLLSHRAEAVLFAKPILIVMHRKESEPGLIGQWLNARRLKADIRRPRFGDPLPPHLDEHAAAIVFGGPMSANDSDDYIIREIGWIGVPLAENKPFLGICLGAQMLAKHLGACVYQHRENFVEVGYEPITPSYKGSALCRWPSHVYHWHGEGFGLCRGGEVLAHGLVFENQAFRYGEHAFGLQFHPEITRAMIHRWTASSSPRMRQRGAQPREVQLAAHDRYGADMRAWTFSFLDRWLKGGTLCRNATLPQYGSPAPSQFAA